jgi:hypothetical protein
MRDAVQGGIATYERSSWQIAARTFCRRHRKPLILGLPGWQDEEHTEDNCTPLTALEMAVAAIRA